MTKSKVSEPLDTFVITVALANGRSHQFSLRDACDINLDDLQTESAGQATRYAFYAMLQVDMKDAVTTQKQALEAIEADVDKEVRTKLGDTKTTETHIKKLRDGYPKIKEARAKLAALEKMEKQLGVIREALVHRRDMLASVAMYRAPEVPASIERRAVRHTYQLKHS